MALVVSSASCASWLHVEMGRRDENFPLLNASAHAFVDVRDDHTRVRVLGPVRLHRSFRLRPLVVIGRPARWLPLLGRLRLELLHDGRVRLALRLLSGLI